MGRTFTAEEERDLTLPEDSINRAKLLEIKERTFEFADRTTGERKSATTLEWWWEITRPMAGLDDEYIGRRIKGECRPQLTNRAGNRLREWSEAILDREIPVGFVLDVDDLIGLEAEIVIGHRKDKNDPKKVWEEVIGVLPCGRDDSPPF